MSVGRYDPSGTPIIPPTEYQRNADEIHRARQLIAEAEQRNETGRANFEQLEAQERELKRLAEVGQRAAQRLQEIERLKAEAQRSSTRLIPNQSSNTSRIEGLGQSNQTASKGASLDEPTPTASLNSQQGSSHQTAYAQQYGANVPAYLPSTYTGYYPGAQFNNYPYGASWAVPQYSASSSAGANYNQSQASSYSTSTSSPVQSNVPQADSSRYYRPSAFQSTGSSATSSQSAHQYHVGATSNTAAASVPIPATTSRSQNPSNAQYSQQSVYNPYQGLGGSTNSLNSFGNHSATGLHSNPPNSSNGVQNVHVSAHPSGVQLPTVQSSTSSSSAATPHVPQLVLRRANQEPIPVIPDPNPADTLKLWKNLEMWAKASADDLQATDKFFYLRDWKVFGTREKDRSLSIAMTQNLRDVRKYSLKDFFNIFFRSIYLRAPVDGPSFPWSQSVTEGAQKIPPTSSSSPLNSSHYTSKTPSMAPSAPSGAPQNQNTRPPSNTVLTPSSAPNKSPVATSRSPGQANKKTIARDLLFNLGKKRPRTLSGEGTGQPAKRQASEGVVQSPQTSVLPGPSSQVPNTAMAKAPVPLPQAPLPEVSKQPAHPVPNVAMTGAATAGINASDVVAPLAATQKSAPAPAQVAGSSKLSNPQPAGTLRMIPYIPQIAGSSATPTLKPTIQTIDPSIATASRPAPEPPFMSGPSTSSNARPVGFSRLVEDVSKSAGSVNILQPKPVPAAALTASSSSPKKSRPVVELPPITTISSSSSSSTQNVTRPVANIKSMTTAPAPGPVASTSKLPTRQSPEPLFLPSSSPELGSPPTRYLDDTPELQRVIGPENTVDKGKGKMVNKGKKTASVYISVPPEPEYLAQYRTQIRERVARGQPLTAQETMVLRLKRDSRTDSLSTSTSRAEEEDFMFALEAQHLSPQDKDEHEAVRLACNRLQELPCRWNGCDCVLNSVQSLIRHLRQHERSQPTKSFMCKWTQCGQHIRPKDGHLERHALLPFRCAYTDCDDSFRSAAQLLKHFRSCHENGTLKPSYKPSPPTSLPLRLLPVKLVPTYLLITDQVKGAAMSRERHEAIGRWVTRNITTSGVQAKSRPRKVKGARSSNQYAKDERDDYEFLTTRPTRYSTYVSTPVDLDLADLDSADISRMIDEEDFTLWGSEGGDEEVTDGNGLQPPDSPLFSPRVTSGRIEEIKTDSEDGPIIDTSRNPRDEDGSDDEDAAVEIMLTGMSWTS